MEQLIKKIEDYYNLNVKEIIKNEESTDGNVYIIITNNNRVIMKIYDDLNHVKSIIKLHNYISNNMNIPNIIKTKNSKDYKKYNNKYLVLFTFLEGEKVKEYIGNNEIIKRIAKEIRKLHDLTEGRNTFNLKKVPFRINSNLKRNTILHFDLTKENIFYNKKNNSIGIIDFDDAKYGPAVVDVAICCSLLFMSKSKGLDKKSMNIFLNEYYNGDDDEMKYIKEISLSWVEYIMNNNEFSTSTNESFQVKKELIENNL